MSDLKLFVTGTENPDPDDWGVVDEIDLVLAYSKEEAIEMSYSGGKPANDEAVEVLFDKPRILYQAPSADSVMGEDV